MSSRLLWNDGALRIAVPTLRKFDDETLEFYLIVASVYGCLNVLQTKVTQESFRRISKVIEEDLRSWDADASSFVIDCMRFVEHGLGELARREGRNPTSSDLADHIGTWVLWNLYGRAPSSDEMKPARKIGLACLVSFNNWWDQDATGNE